MHIKSASLILASGFALFLLNLPNILNIGFDFGFFAKAVAAENISTQAISINKVWIREAPPNSKILAAYLQIENNSAESIDLVAAESEAFERIEFHLSEMTNGVARMRTQDKISVTANSTFEFTPGGYHLMLINPTVPMREGMHATIKFVFANGDSQTVETPVIRADSTEAHQHHDNHEHHH